MKKIIKINNCWKIYKFQSQKNQMKHLIKKYKLGLKNSKKKTSKFGKKALKWLKEDFKNQVFKN